MLFKFTFNYATDFSCIWSGDSEAFHKYGSIIEHEKIGISKELDLEMQGLCKEYQSSLNWDCPQEPSPWTDEQKQLFARKARSVYDKLISEIGERYHIQYDVFIP
ncbi:MAG: hypothetical protein J1F03_08065 [Oscillospiraceae bacterium]|nr:hypothetical protein [Oscillospiraceae bacterium]